MFAGALETGPTRAARVFREHLKLAGVDRSELFERTPFRRPLRVHDLRATFITLALAGGRSETWVQDRTGHTTSLMLSKYRRQSRNASELALGGLKPLNEALPELREVGKRVGSDGGTPGASTISRFPEVATRGAAGPRMTAHGPRRSPCSKSSTRM